MPRNLIYSGIFVISILYVWAIVCFTFFRFSRPETESRMTGFLKSHYKFFTGSANKENWDSLTKDKVRRASLWGWVFPSLPFCLLANSDWNYKYVLVSVGVLFFGGLYFAFGWYGIRCLRLLEHDFEERKKGKKSNKQN